MTEQTERPQAPIFTFESRGAMEVYESLEDLEAQVEPLLVEEVHSAFDHQARPVQIALVDEASRIVLGSLEPDLDGLKRAVAEVSWILPLDLPADEVSPAAYVHGLLRAYALAVERDAKRQGWLGRIFNRRK